MISLIISCTGCPIYADQTVQVAQSMLFKGARWFRQSGQQQRNTPNVTATTTNQHVMSISTWFVATALFHVGSLGSNKEVQSQFQK